MTSQTENRKRPHSAGRAARGRLLLAAAALFLALAAVVSPWVFEGSASSDEPRLTIVASSCLVNICPGKKSGGVITLRAEGYKPPCSAGYSWEVDGGRIVGEGREVEWDLRGTRPGASGKFYDARVTVACGSRRVVSQTKRVLVWDCPREKPTPSPTVTPTPPPTPEPTPTPDFPTPTPTPVITPTPIITPTPAHERFTLRVAVVSAHDRSPVPGARVSLYLGGTLVAGDERADAEGVYTREALAPGTYRVHAAAERFAEGDMTVNLFRSLSGPVIFSLTPNPAPTPTPTLTPSPSPTPTPPGDGNSNSAANANTEANSNSNDGIIGVTNGNAGGAGNRNGGPGPSPSPDIIVKDWPPPWWPLALAALAALGVAAYLASKSFGAAAGTTEEAAAKVAEQSLEAAAGTTKNADPVHCTAFSRTQVVPDDSFEVIVFAHLESQRKSLAAAAAVVDDKARGRESALLGREIPREATLTFRLQMFGLEAVDTEQSLVWKGGVEPPQSVRFLVYVPKDAKPHNAVGRVLIYCEGAEVGRLSFNISVVETISEKDEAYAELVQKLMRYRKAFISYCSQDRVEVLKRLQGLETGFNIFGVPYFIDQDSIKQGENWRRAIETNLDDTDLFVLFWSKAARDSEGVADEIEYAMRRKGDDEDRPPYFQPIAVEFPIPQPLPAGLEEIHFGSKTLLMEKGQEAADAEKASQG